MLKRLVVNFIITIVLTLTFSLAWIRFCRLFYPTIDFDMSAENIDGIALFADFVLIVSCLPMFLLLITRVRSRLLLLLPCYFLTSIICVILLTIFFVNQSNFFHGDFPLFIVPMLIGLAVHTLLYFRFIHREFTVKIHSAYNTYHKLP